MNDVAFGTVRLKQDVGPGTYTNTYACQFHSTQPVAFSVGRTFWCLSLEFITRWLSKVNNASHSTLKGERVKFLVHPVLLHLGGKKHCLLEGTWVSLTCPSGKSKSNMNIE
jgi:hypothetical protein